MKLTARSFVAWSCATVGGALIGVSLTALLLTGCSMFGANPSAPTKPESLLYSTTTNYIPVVVPAYVTNVVTVTQTNVAGVTVFQTNTVPVTVPAQTNQVPAYTETLKPGVAGAIQAGGSLLNTLFPGIGSIATNAVIALLGAWGYARSQKQGANNTAALTQEIEVARQLLQSVPNGAALDSQFVTFIQNHQADAGVLQQVMGVIASEVSNKDAVTAAQQIAQTVAALTGATTQPKV